MVYISKRRVVDAATRVRAVQWRRQELTRGGA
jgi:hypothetical protein